VAREVIRGNAIKRRRLALPDDLQDERREDAEEDEDARGTPQQRLIIEHQAKKGERIRVQAFAGTGKTTTAVLLAEHIGKTTPNARILYLVFNSSAREEATKRFPTDNVKVLTAHAFAYQRMGYKRGDVGLEEISTDYAIDVLELNDWVKRQTGSRINTPKTMSKVTRRVANWIIKTFKAFLASDDPEIGLQHLYWKAGEPVKELSRDGDGKVLPSAELIQRATELWEGMKSDPRRLSHDGYMKLFAMEGLNVVQPFPRCACGIPLDIIDCRFGEFAKCSRCSEVGNLGYTHIMVDEAQDFSKAQAQACSQP